MASVRAVHDAPSDINSGACDTAALVDVGNRIDGSAVDSHANMDVRMTAQRLTEFERTLDRRLRIREKDQRHSVAGRDSDQFLCCFARPEMGSFPNDLI